MFQQPSEPKPGSSDSSKARPLSNEPATAASAVASSSSTANTSKSSQQVAPAASTTTTNDYSRLDEQQMHQSQGQNRQQQQQQQQPNKLSYSVSKQQIAATALHQHYLNYFNSNIPKEEAKSHRTRGSISHSLSQTRQLLQQQQQQLQQAVFHNQDPPPPPPPPPPHQLDHPVVPQSAAIAANQRTNHLHHNHIYHIPATSNYHPPSSQNHHYASPANHTTASVSNMSRSAPRHDTFVSHKIPQHQQQSQKQMNPTLNHRTYSTGAIASSHPQQQQQQYQSHSMNPNKQQQHAATKILARSTRQGQLDKDSEDKAAAIKGELENDLEGYKNSELEAISSLERNLPIELSFLIRQQAHCMARMNYLDRQLRELRESAFHLQQQQHHPHQQQVDANQVSSTSIMNQGHHHLNASRQQQQQQHASSNMQTTTMSNGKNGNFILSDDSGGEYSRATISDDDELSSLLDQIAKSVRPDLQQQQQRPPVMMSNATDALLSGQMRNLQQQQQQRLTANYTTFMGNQPPPLHLQHQQQQHQSYAIINPNQLHHHQQAVPIFVMSSPIAVAHPSSISSNILPGVHFQPEPRYNQYYEDFYNTSSGGGGGVNPHGAAPHSVMATMPQASAPAPVQHRPFNSGGGGGGGGGNNNGFRSQQFDSSMSAVEQLISQKEKRQIISQLKSADNWLKMRASSQEQESSSSVKASEQQAINSSHQGDIGQTTTTLPSANGNDLRTNSSSTIKHEGGDRVIEENVGE